MRFLPSCFFLALAIFAAGPAYAADSVAAAKTISGSEIALADGRILHLEGIEQPFENTPGWRSNAVQALQDIAGGRQLALDGDTTDRYGRITAQAYALGDGGEKIWLQGEMLKRGLAFVYPPTGAEARLDEMRGLEAAARRAKAGIWAGDAYADIAANKLWGKEGKFAFVAGTVLDAKRVKEMVYIHFGDNWRTSLTLAIAAHDLHAFRAANIDPLTFTGKTIRARGWVKHDIGPMILITAPGQIEILPPR